MKNTAINTLSYTGVVTLSQYIGQRKIKLAQTHNTGGASLFDFLSSCLIGDFDRAKAIIPTKIMLLTYDSTEPDTINNYVQASGFISLLTPPERIDSDGLSKVRYSFIIPRDTMASLPTTGSFGIGLYAKGVKDTEPSNFAAFCKIGLGRNDLVNAALVVDWELLISNAESLATEEANYLSSQII